MWLTQLHSFASPSTSFLIAFLSLVISPLGLEYTTRPFPMSRLTTARWLAAPSNLFPAQGQQQAQKSAQPTAQSCNLSLHLHTGLSEHAPCSCSEPTDGESEGCHLFTEDAAGYNPSRPSGGWSDVEDFLDYPMVMDTEIEKDLHLGKSWPQAPHPFTLLFSSDWYLNTFFHLSGYDRSKPTVPRSVVQEANRYSEGNVKLCSKFFLGQQNHHSYTRDLSLDHRYFNPTCHQRLARLDAPLCSL